MITEPVVGDDHVEIRDLVRDVVSTTFTSERVRAAAATPSGFDEVAWKQLVDLGWTSVTQDEAVGGDGLGTLVQCVIHRELAARLAPTPFLAGTGFASTALAQLGGPAALDLRREVAAGERTAALVLGGGRGWLDDGAADVSAGQSDGAWVLEGSAAMVLDGARAEVLVVVAELADGGWGLFAVDGEAPRVTRTHVDGVDATRSLGDVELDGAAARPLHEAPIDRARIDALVDRLAVLLSAEMVGEAMSCLQRTLDYLRTRHQFGRPIGSFQALKHRCADAAVALTIAQEHVFTAAEMVDAGDEESLRLAAPLALGRAGEVSRHVAQEAIQLHGGVGFSHEVDIGLYYKRAITDVELLAAPEEAYARLDRLRTGS